MNTANRKLVLAAACVAAVLSIGLQEAAAFPPPFADLGNQRPGASALDNVVPGPFERVPNPQPPGNNGGGGGAGGNNGSDLRDIFDGIGGILDHFRPNRQPGGRYPWPPGSGYVPPSGNYVPPNSGGWGGSLPPNMLPNQQIVVINPAQNAAPVQFVLRDRTYALKPGYRLTMQVAGSAIIRFDRGGYYGAQRYTLSDGEFVFKLTGAGWNLVRRRVGSITDDAGIIAPAN